MAAWLSASASASRTALSWAAIRRSSASDECLNRNRLWRGEGQIVQRPPLALFASVLAHAIRTMPRTKEFSGFRVQPLANRLKLLPSHLSAQAEQLRTAAMPFALNTAVLVVVVAVFEMPLGIPGTARHGPYRQHQPTVTLFEIRMQRRLRGSILQASSGHFRPRRLLAALVLKVDTIPKPDGLGLRNA